jgi:RHS repeat-associated protein
MPYDNFEFDHLNVGATADSGLKPTTKTGILGQMKAAGHAFLAPVKRVGGKAIFSAMLMAAAALCTPQPTSAQSTADANAQVTSVLGVSPWVQVNTSSPYDEALPPAPLSHFTGLKCQVNVSYSTLYNAEQCISEYLAFTGVWFRTDLGLDSTGSFPPNGNYRQETSGIELPRCSAPFTEGGSQQYIDCQIIEAPQALAPLPPYGKTLGSATDVPGDCGCGDPITVGTGNVFEKVADYKTAGPNPLDFGRYYNSMAGAAAGETFATSLGTNWRSNYDRYLHLTYTSGFLTSITAERADGQMINFAGGGPWTSDSDVDVKLSNSGTTWTIKDHNDTVETYTVLANKTEAQLNSITTRGGYEQTMNYTSGVLTSVTDSYSRTLEFTYSNGLLETVTTPDNLTLTFGYNASGIHGTTLDRLASISYSTSPVTSQTYVYENTNLPFSLTGVIDENNNRLSTWGYDQYGRGTSSERGSGANLTTVTYNSDGTNTVTNPFGVADTYTFTTLQGAPKMTQISRAATPTTAAATEFFAYDTNGYTNSATDWNVNTTTYVNNAQGNPTTINEAVGSPVARTTTISYDPTWLHEPHQIITPGLTSTFVYDGSGNPLTRTDLDTTTNTVPYSTNGQSRVTTWTWSTTGQELSEQLPRTDVTAKTTFTFTGGTLTQIQDALGHLTKITSYTEGGLPKTVVDPNNVTTTLVYDARLNLNTSTLATTAGNLVTTYTHDPANQLTAVKLPDSSKLTYGYDTAHRLKTITDLLGNSVNYTLDALADKTLIQVKNPSGTVKQSHSGTFDALGRVLTDVGGMSQTTTYTWDKNSNALTITPPSPSGEIKQTWDALNRLATRVDPSPGGTTTLTYDAHDKPLTVKDANGNTTAYVNDGFSERTQTTSPDSGTSVYHYDPDRNLTQKVLAGSLTVNATYDALDRPLATTYPNDSTLNVSRTFDQAGHGFGVGRLTSATDQAGTLSNTFDERGNVTAESRAVTSVGTLATTTTFDAASNISSIKYPSTTLVTYTRNSMGQVTALTAKPPGASSASNVATGVTYEPFGPVTGLSFGNGITGTYGYDLDYRPTTRVDTGTSAVLNLTYGYDANNSVHTITDAVNAANTQTLGYDTLDRLTSATSGAGGYGTYGWTWDAASNVKTQVINGTTTTYSLTAGTSKLSQWVTGSTTEVVANTAAGNINTLKIGSTTQETLTYNQANQLASEATTSTAATYKYGFTGERLEKAVSGSNPVIYHYGQAARELLSENDLHSGQRADYIYLNGSPVGEVDPVAGKLYFTHTDRLGTPQKLTDSTKAVDWAATYNPFGNTVSFSGTLTNQSIRLPGQYFDPETSMNHNGFRDYAGSMTRYVESDRIGLAGGTNTFQYAKGNPFKYTDPKGLSAVYVYVWNADPSSASVGHVAITDTSGNTLLSQFPYATEEHSAIGPNTQLTLSQTMNREGRLPDSVYQVSIPNASAFSNAAVVYGSRVPTWVVSPETYGATGNVGTNCTSAAFKALKAGGVPLGDSAPILPGSLGAALNSLTSTGIVTKLNYTPFAYTPTP